MKQIQNLTCIHVQIQCDQRCYFECAYMHIRQSMWDLYFFYAVSQFLRAEIKKDNLQHVKLVATWFQSMTTWSWQVVGIKRHLAMLYQVISTRLGGFYLQSGFQGLKEMLKMVVNLANWETFLYSPKCSGSVFRIIKNNGQPLARQVCNDCQISASIVRM